MFNKKSVIILLALALSASLIACNAPVAPVATPTPPAATEPPAVETPEPTVTPAIETPVPEATLTPEPVRPDIELGEDEYVGVGAGGMGGKITVKVKMNGSVIEKIEVVKHAETEGIGTPAIKELPAKIIEAQSVEVDDYSGATMTSQALKNAVKDALSQVK